MRKYAGSPRRAAATVIVVVALALPTHVCRHGPQATRITTDLSPDRPLKDS
jgi:hypothetical protein